MSGGGKGRRGRRPSSGAEWGLAREACKENLLVLYKLPLVLTVVFKNATNTEGGFVSIFGFETKIVVQFSSDTG